MFQNNPLLAQLKQKLHEQAPRIEGVVKGTDKGFGFLEAEGNKSYFIPPPQMKKVMSGDKIIACIQIQNEREIAEPESLIEPFLNRFIGRIHLKEKDKRLFIIPDHPLLKDAIPCRIMPGIERDFQADDWVVAEMRQHPLVSGSIFQAELTEFITDAVDHFTPWWVTLARNQLEKTAPTFVPTAISDNEVERQDLTHLNFFTIDSVSTEDMDDALYIEKDEHNNYVLAIAIADPTAYITEGSELDIIASQRAFTNYLPGFDIPMLPRELSDNICSLRANEYRPALVCRAIIQPDGTLSDNVEFINAQIKSKAKLNYNDVSNWLDKIGDWQPEHDEIAQQLILLHSLTEVRLQWRQKNALVFKERYDYRFILNDNGDVIDIVTEQRRSANRMIEEAMITANICAARILSEKIGFGIFNTHLGYDVQKLEQLTTILKEFDINVTAEELQTLDGFSRLRRLLDERNNAYLDSRTRRFLTYAEVAITPQPHFGMGLPYYATWTSPIRKYGDIVNHRLLKAFIHNQPAQQPDVALLQRFAERRKANRGAEREISDWLYTRFLNEKISLDMTYNAEIFDISRGGMRVRLLENGASAFIPATFIHANREELVCAQDIGIIQIKGEVRYRLGDTLLIKLHEVRLDTRNIIVKPALE